jgi:hypothetical protein
MVGYFPYPTKLFIQIRLSRAKKQQQHLYESMVQCLHWPNTFPYLPFPLAEERIRRTDAKENGGGPLHACSIWSHTCLYKLATSKSNLQARNIGLKIPLLLGSSQSLKRSHNFPFRQQKREYIRLSDAKKCAKARAIRTKVSSF